MKAAPFALFTPYAPTSAVVPSADRATATPNCGWSPLPEASLIGPAPSRAWIASANPPGIATCTLRGAVADEPRPEPVRSAAATTTAVALVTTSFRYIASSPLVEPLLSRYLPILTLTFDPGRRRRPGRGLCETTCFRCFFVAGTRLTLPGR